MKPMAYYFGCIGDSGHYLWAEGGRRISPHSSELQDRFPCQYNALDGGLIPPSGHYHAEGVYFAAYINGWTVVSFNDNSVDTRPGSHSVFIVEGIHTPDDALKIASAAFAFVVARFKFELTAAAAAKEN